MLTSQCPRCAKAAPLGASFCRRCGADLSAEKAVLRPARRARPVIRMAVIAAAVLPMIFMMLARSAHVGPPPATVTSPPMRLPVERRQRSPTAPPPPPLSAWERHLPDGLPPANDALAATDFRGQSLQNRSFKSGVLRRAIFAGADLLQADFVRADLSDADLRGADLTQVDFSGANLSGGQFGGARLHQTTFAGRDRAAVAGQTRVRNGIREPVPPPPLPARGMEYSTFQMARFTQVDLGGLVLARASFIGASFDQVSLRDADLTGANFRESRHGLTDFARAKTAGADFCGADLASALNLTPAQIEAAITDDRTRLPNR